MECPDRVSSNWRYIAFSDEPVQGSVWEVRKLCPGVKNQREKKILAIKEFHEEGYELTIYHDANMTLQIMPDMLLSYHKKEITLLQHPLRDCIYQEMTACQNYGLDNPDVMAEQVAKYRREGYPEHAGMVQTGLMIRTYSPELLSAMQLWNQEIQKGSHRDQLSFNYIANKMRLVYDTIPWNEFLGVAKIHNHLNKK